MAEIPHTGVGTPSDPQQARPAIRVFASPVLQGAVVLVPVAVTAVLVAFRSFEGDPMLATGLAAVVAGFVVFLVFASRVPGASSSSDSEASSTLPTPPTTRRSSRASGAC
jgi:zinc transporter ZupT